MNLKRALAPFVLLGALTTPALAQSGAAEASIFRLVTFQTTAELRLGATQGNGEAGIIDIHNAILALMAAGAPEVRNLAYIPADMKSLIEVGDTGVAAVKTVYRAALAQKASGKLVDPGGERRVFYPLTAVRLRSPITNPQKVFGIAANYRSVDAPVTPPTRPNPAPPRPPSALSRAADPSLPSYFLKSVSGIIGQDDEIVMTDLMKDGLPSSHEAELAVVIGKTAKNITEAEAMDYVFGYTVHND
ncbi:MAG: fumarylacetoacetate hydrolase family protein, partial [Vicinamibacteria bacterium]|nr:fumarylacetoacetate hydrolase family protein [Vicinamibacteria bacterium]